MSGMSEWTLDQATGYYYNPGHFVPSRDRSYDLCNQGDAFVLTPFVFFVGLSHEVLL